jgi:hypothetical protein
MRARTINVPIQRDGRFVLSARIGLNENHIESARCSYPFKFFNQRCRDSFSPMRYCDSQVIDVDLTALLLELSKFVGRDATDDLVIL